MFPRIISCVAKPSDKRRSQRSITVSGHPIAQDWSDLPTWTARLMTTHFSDASGRFSKSDLTEYLGKLFAYVYDTQGGNRGGDTLRVLMSIEQLKQAFETDDDAEIIRRGIRLGLHLSAFDRDTYYLNVHAQHRKKGHATKLARLEKRNGEMRQQYAALKKRRGDLGARQQLRDEYGLSLEMVTKIVKP